MQNTFTIFLISDIIERGENYEVIRTNTRKILQITRSAVRDTYRAPYCRTRRMREVRDFTASIQSGRLAYRFFVPFQADLSSAEQILQVMIYDETFFCDIAFKENEPVQVSAPGSIVSEYRIQRNRDRKIVYDAFDTTGAREDIDYTGTVHPFEVRLSFKRR